MGRALFDLLLQKDSRIGFDLDNPLFDIQRQYLPLSAVTMRSSPFFMAHIRPQTINLNLNDVIIIEQNRFYLLSMKSCFTQKG